MTIISAPMSCVPTARGTTATLTHACELNESGDIVKVLCGRAKPAHILDDSAMHNVRPVDCPVCQVRIRQQR